MIRAARQSDLAALVAIENCCFTTDRLSRRSLRYFLKAANAILLVAVAEERLAGYALVACRKGSEIGRLYSIAIDPAFRGRNLGLALLRKAEMAARRRGVVRMRLEVRSRNRRAIALYEGSGYRRFGRFEDYYEDGATALRYEKRLRKALNRSAAPF